MTQNILVVGPTYSGKTSVVNALTESSSSSSHPGSLKQLKIDEKKCRKDGRHYRFYDTPGLHEAYQNEMRDKEKAECLKELMHLKESGSIKLILFVTRKGRIHQEAQDIYHLAAIHVFEDKLPVIGIVTGCENEYNMDDWVHQNEEYFQLNEMNFAKLLGTYFGSTTGPLKERMASLHKESTEKVWEKIKKCRKYKGQALSILR